MSRIKRIVISLVAALGLIAPVMAPVAVRAAEADTDGSLRCGSQLEFDTSGGCAADDNAASRLDGIISNVINIISLIVGVVAVIMIIIGGLRYITSSGDSGQVGNAKNTIIYAIVGLIVVALAQVIVRFVVNRATEPTTE